MLGTRVGEALKPGPTRFAIINPTSIISKISQFDVLANQCQIDIVCASETSATSKAQKLFSRQLRTECHYKSLWSAPVSNQFDRLDGDVSLRGRAAGVGVFSRLPSRHALKTIDDQLLATARLVHTIHTVGDLQFQVITLYGLATHSQESNQQTDNLFRAALEATDHMRLPTIIAGDFNCDPFTLDCCPLIRARRLSDLPTQYARMYGAPMPPTCRECTHPDNALLCPMMAPWLTSIEVMTEPLFDTHKVVLFTLDISSQDAMNTRLVLPQSWIEFPIQTSLIKEHYLRSATTPTDLTSWAIKVETAVDAAYQQTQLVQGTAPNQVLALPRRAKGRCVSRKPASLPQRALLPKTRPGEYLPKFEIHRFATLKMLKQLRRLQALRRRVAKVDGGGSITGLQLEWSSILWADSPPGGFVAWCNSMPELGPPPQAWPSLDFLYSAEQLLKFQVDRAVDFDHKCWIQKLKYARYLDAKDQGHAQACNHLRDKDTPPLTELKETIREECSIVVEQPDRVWAYCDNADHFQCRAPAQVAGCECRVTHIDQYGLQLKPLTMDFDWPPEASISQEQVLTRPQDIVEKLNQFYMPYWGHPDANRDMSQEFQAFLDTLPELPNPVVHLDQIDLWNKAVADLKPHSARGVDGISAAELQSLPTQAIADLAKILCSFHQGFPPWMMVARTFAVPKCTTTPSSRDIRPITVLAQLYRLWARVVCSQVLQHYSPLLPPEIWGLLRGRGPFTASYQMQWWLEKLALQKTANAGLVLDLIKCFNSIHRPTVYAILVRLGLPQSILEQWSRSLAVLTRTWALQGFDSHLTPCAHGFPEGDVFSVIAMIGVALSWTSRLKHLCPASLVGAYADNWCLASIRKPDFPVLIATTLQFVHLLYMAIDWHKTWIWATDASLLASLKHALKQQLPNLSIARLTTAMDLGSQMTYSGPPRLGKFRTRLSLFKKRCQLLQSMPHDVYTKAHLARTAILPTLYGVALLPLGESHTTAMRSQLANAILGYNHSRNSTLAIQFLPSLIDPAIWVILQALEAARRFLLQATPDDQHLFFQVLATHNGSSNACKGPASCLKHYLLRLGWTVTPTGWVHVSAFVSLDLLTTSKQTWKFWALHTWQQEFLQFCDRKALQGTIPVNLADTRAVLFKLPPGKFARIIQEISGAFQTANQKQKWDLTASLKCSYCIHDDSRHHRIYECPATDPIRSRHQDIVEHFRFDSDVMHELPVLFVHPQQELVQTLHWTQPVATFEVALVEKILQLYESGFLPTFYTDGSCQCPTIPSVSYASFSIVLDLCTEDTESTIAAKGFKLTGVLPASLRTVVVSRTQGQQKIARSELYAVLLIVETFPAAEIYSDSQTTIDRFHVCQEDKDPLTWIDSDDMDLLLRLQKAVGSRHRIHKVAAHVDPKFTTNDLECYRQLGNMVANDSAIKSCRSLHPWLVKACVSMCNAVHESRTLLAKWYDYVLELQQHCAILQTNQSQEVGEPTTRAQQQTSLQRLQHWSVDDAWKPDILRLSNATDTSWGRLIGPAMLQWMELVTWPKDNSSDDFGVTWMELVLSFSIHIGCYFPVPRHGVDGQQFLVSLYNLEQVQQFQVHFSDLANNFAILYGQMDKLTFPRRWPQTKRGLVRAAYALGSLTHSAGFVSRPAFPHQEVVVGILKEHFGKEKTQKHSLVPVLPFRPLWPQATLDATLAGPWQKKSLATQALMREFQKTIQSEKNGPRQQTLSFG